MKTLYIECNMGVAGDMLLSALLELLPAEEQEAFFRKFHSLGIPGVEISMEKAVKCGITGTHVRVLVNGGEEGCDHGHEHTHGHHHDHRSLADIRSIIGGLDVSEKVKKDALAVYDLIAQAESAVHGETMEHIHFHEVGSLDAVADVVGNCLLLEAIGADRIAVSPIHVGSGTVKCAHGILPVPAPATALILAGIPVYSGEIRGELCTPTGAALVKHFGQSFGPMPAMAIEKVGYGMGTRDFGEVVNCVRVLLGETADGASADKFADTAPTAILELACNLDDMTGEEIGFAMERLLQAGALDVYTQPITMKKSRPAVILTALIQPEDREKMTELLFRHTSTIGVRCCAWERAVLQRETVSRQTPWGPVQVKRCSGYGMEKEKAEFEDLARIAREQGLSLRQVKEGLK